MEVIYLLILHFGLEPWALIKPGARYTIAALFHFGKVLFLCAGQKDLAFGLPAVCKVISHARWKAMAPHVY